MGGIPKPTYEFSIPSIHDDTALACRIYTAFDGPLELRRPPATGRALIRISQANKPTKRLLKGAVIAHNYPRGGGSYDNSVVLRAVRKLLDEEIIVGTFNFRGVGKSRGKSTWTGKAELQDYISFVGFFLHYLTGVIQQTDLVSLAAGSAPGVQLIIAGYDYGALMTRHLPDIPTIVQRFSNVLKTSTEAEIYSRASRLASITTIDLASDADLQTMEEDVPGATQILDNKGKNYMKQLKVPFFRKTQEQPRPDQDPGRPLSDEDYTARGEVCLPEETLYILISILLGPAATLATGFKKLGDNDMKKLDEKFQRNATWLIHGGSDQITGSQRLLEWQEEIKSMDHIKCELLGDPKAGHYWNGKGIMDHYEMIFGSIVHRWAAKERPHLPTLLQTITERTERPDSGGAEGKRENVENERPVKKGEGGTGRPGRFIKELSSTMFASTFLSHLKSSTSQPLLPISSTHSSVPASYTDNPTPSPSDTQATLLALARQEAHLQSHIQYLLDVQSDRLLEGLGASDPTSSSPPLSSPSSSGRSHNKTSTHLHDGYNNNNHASPHSHSTFPTTPRARTSKAQSKPTLQSTRKQLLTAIHTLHTLKSSTSSILSTSLSAISVEQTRITSLLSRKSALETTIAELESSPLSLSLADLAHEEGVLDKQIYELEGKLYELKARRGEVQRKRREGRNRIEAGLSSYKGSLEIAEREAEGILWRGAVVKISNGRAALDGGMALGKGKGRQKQNEDEAEAEVWELPPKRRKLSMVQDFYTHQSSTLESQFRSIELETTALEEGAGVWEDVCREVTNVERMEERSENSEKKSQEPIHRILQAMALAREKVGDALKTAEDKGWNLLVVCVGAEMEALVQGEEVLRGVGGAVGEEDRGARGDSERDGERDGERRGEGGGEGNGERNRGLGGKGIPEDTEDDDEPGPELLLSVQEDDEQGR
ncbi:MAG: hypothetical protein Q9169_006369 [Polycauliona sp. 2 TL-2023]